MRAKLLVNDIHLGVHRASGTTPQSAMMIREYLLESFRALLMKHLDKDVVVNGDLFDAFSIALVDALGAYQVLRDWLLASRERDYTSEGWIGPKLFAGMGNHDWSKDSNKLSTFHFILSLLHAEFGERIVLVDKPQWIELGAIYMVPHMPNQDLFDLALKQVYQVEEGILLLHANWNNDFAIESDHSLNVSEAQSKSLVERGWTLVFGHEHQARTALERSVPDFSRAADWGVIVTGNQWPSSVADCQNNPDDRKYAHIIETDLSLTPIETWDAEDDFHQLRWNDELAGYSGFARFIRVCGEAAASEAPDVVKAISDFRQGADGVFVVTNGVVVEGAANMGELKATAETIKSFDVMGYLLEQLDPPQAAKVKELLGKAELREAA